MQTGCFAAAGDGTQSIT